MQINICKKKTGARKEDANAGTVDGVALGGDHQQWGHHRWATHGQSQQASTGAGRDQPPAARRETQRQKEDREGEKGRGKQHSSCGKACLRE